MSTDISSLSFPLGSSASNPMGLLNSRGTLIESATNTSLQTAFNTGRFQNDSIYNGTVSSSDSQDYYQLNIASNTSTSLVLSGLQAGVSLQLLDGNGAIVSGLSDDSGAGLQQFRGDLTPGTYYVRVFSVDSQPSSYSLSYYSGQVFYVSPFGADTNAGSVTAPFRSVQQAADAATAGDTVMIRDGTYYERSINLSNSGTADQPITIAATPGESVTINCGLAVSTWTSVNGTIYSGKPILPDPSLDFPGNTVQVIVGQSPLQRVDQQAQLTAGTFWVDTDGTLYVWTPGGVDPGSTETLIINQRDQFNTTGLRIFGNNHYVLDGFSIKAAEIGVWAANFSPDPAVMGQELTLENMEISYAWQGGVRFDKWNGAVIENCDIHDNVQENFPRGRSGWSHAIIGFNAINITVRDSQIHNNHGEGVGPYLGCDNWQILNNVIYDNWSVNVYVDTDIGDVLIDGNFIFNTGMYRGDVRNYADGIRIANEAADFLGTDSTPGVTNVTVTNNVIVNTGTGIQFIAYDQGPSFLQDSLIANNTIGPTDGGNGTNFNAIAIDVGSNVSVVNNIAASNRITLSAGIGTTGIVAANNLVSSPRRITTRGNGVTVSNTIYGDPQFVDSFAFVAANYAVKATSPAQNRGQLVPGLTKDFRGVTRPSTGITLGAFQDPATSSTLSPVVVANSSANAPMGLAPASALPLASAEGAFPTDQFNPTWLA